MSKAVRYIFSAVIIMTLVFGSMAMAPAATSDALIHLKGGSFVAAQSQAAAGSQKYYIVQFTGPVQQSWKDEVSAEGAEILAYIPDFAFKVRMNPAIARRLEGKNFVNAVVAFQSEFKFGADLKRGDEISLYRIRVEKGSDYGLVRSLIARTGVEILGFEEDTLFVAANSAFIDAIAEVDDVASINNYALNQTFNSPSAPAGNDTSRDIIGATAANGRGYDGSTKRSQWQIQVWEAAQLPPPIVTSTVASAPFSTGPARQADVSKRSRMMVPLTWTLVTAPIQPAQC